MIVRGAPDRDPRAQPSDATPSTVYDDDLRPAVAATGRRGGAWPIFGGAAALGAVAFLVLSATRNQNDAAPSMPPQGRTSAAPISATPPPPELALAEAAGRGAAAANPLIVVAPPAPASPTTAAPVAAVNLGETSEAQRLRSPSLVVDLGGGATAPAGDVSAARGATAGSGGAAEVKGAATALSGDEQFAHRVGAEQPERAQAIMLHDRSSLIAQGVTITAVLETALNSDLPGFARAVVSRDVRGFDGREVLIPRGSRVIGQYKSAVAQGQSRAFVIWTRVIRPDGASIQIGSSGTDPLGRAGLSGKVNTHFFERFSGAVLLSVVDAGIQSLSSRPSTQVVIGSGQDAVTASLAALVPTAIPPTIKVAQGAAIRIFVARDLDFSTVRSGAQ